MSLEKKPARTQPARKVLLDDTEVLIRGIKLEEWSEDAGRPSPTIFERGNTSVTRIDQIGLSEAIRRVKSDIEKKDIPETALVAAGKISVKQIKDIGLTPIPERQPPKIHHFQVWEDITDTNDMHAEIVPYDDSSHSTPKKRVAFSYSRMLAKSVHLYLTNKEGDVIGENPPEIEKPTDSN